MNKTAFLAIISAALLLAPALAAQEGAHVVEVGSLVSRDAVNPGETFQAAVLLKVQAGYPHQRQRPARRVHDPDRPHRRGRPRLRGRRDLVPRRPPGPLLLLGGRARRL
ncbi:MAG: hypothetical protein M0C28_03455 [Candidatus Moduliflexus flocculans]|nr:hypothetical protein [Candidatus Moduliflexus flocculans]